MSKVKLMCKAFQKDFSDVYRVLREPRITFGGLCFANNNAGCHVHRYVIHIYISEYPFVTFAFHTFCHIGAKKSWPRWFSDGLPQSYSTQDQSSSRIQQRPSRLLRDRNRNHLVNRNDRHLPHPLKR